MNNQSIKVSQLPAEGFVRLPQLIGPNGILPVSRTTLHKLIKAGRWPKPIHLAGQRISVWRVGDVREALTQLSEAC